MSTITYKKLSLRAEKLYIILDWGFAYAKKQVARRSDYDRITVLDVWLKDMKECHRKSLDELLFNDPQITFEAVGDDLVFKVWR